MLRISTGGTRELPAGAIHPDLVRRLSDEAATSASHVLNMCIRALDYLPLVDVTFFEYLRALITADYDLVRDDLKNREALFKRTRRERITLHRKIDNVFKLVPGFARDLGLKARETFEVHSLRSAMRTSPDGRQVPQVVVELTQTEQVPAQGDVPAHIIRGGSTLVVDLSSAQVKYRIFKNIASDTRKARPAGLRRFLACGLTLAV